MKIGCFTLPFRKYPFAKALDAIAAAGFKHVGIWPVHEDLAIFRHEPREEAFVREARKSIASAGLSPSVLFGQHMPLNDAEFATFEIKLEQAADLDCRELLCWGPWPWKTFMKEKRPDADWLRDTQAFFKYLPLCAQKAEKLEVTISFKPHCGLTAASKELLQIVQKVPSPRIKASYDGGNVSFYEGLDPVEDLKPIAAHCASLIIKDHVGGHANAAPGAFPNVGKGKVDHKAMLAILLQHKFTGPVTVEKIEGETLEELSASAKASYETLAGYAKDLGAA
jgi:sugar phosphate isomerase/epimerase